MEKKYYNELMDVLRVLGVVLQADQDGKGELELGEVIAVIKALKDSIEAAIEE